MADFCNPDQELGPLAQALRAGERPLTDRQRAVAKSKPEGWLPLSEEMDAAARNIRAQSEAAYSACVSNVVPEPKDP